MPPRRHRSISSPLQTRKHLESPWLNSNLVLMSSSRETFVKGNIDGFVGGCRRISPISFFGPMRVRGLREDTTMEEAELAVAWWAVGGVASNRSIFPSIKPIRSQSTVRNQRLTYFMSEGTHTHPVARAIEVSRTVCNDATSSISQLNTCIEILLYHIPLLLPPSTRKK